MMFGGFRSLLVVTVLLICSSASTGECDTLAKETGDRVIAIDVLLKPDTTMVERAVEINSRLREDYPKGFTLGKVHVPHITLVQRYVREKDLDAIGAAVAKICAEAKPLDWELQARGIGNGMWSGVAITFINFEPMLKLRDLHNSIVQVVQPFAVDAGSAAAFARSDELPQIDNTTVAYVKAFVSLASGAKYNPHVTVGVAHGDFVKHLKAEPFEKFSFKPLDVAIYQLGNFGTAQKMLWQWNEGKSAQK